MSDANIEPAIEVDPAIEIDPVDTTAIDAVAWKEWSSKAYLTYEEMTDEQRRAVVNATLYATAGIRGPRWTPGLLSAALDGVRRPHPERWVVEIRDVQVGDTYWSSAYEEWVTVGPLHLDRMVGVIQVRKLEVDDGD